MAGIFPQKQFAAERIAALVEEGRAREVDEAARHAVASAKHDELLQRLHKTEDALQATTKDYILGVRSCCFAAAAAPAMTVTCNPICVDV